MNACDVVRQVAGLGMAVGLVLCSGGAFAQDPAPHEIKDKLRGMEQKARELKQAGKPDEAEAVIREARELCRKEQLKERERRGGDTDPELREKLQDMERRAHELKEAGKPEEAEAVIRQAREMHRKAIEREHERRGEPAELARRLQHVREAATHLRAAGMDDAAERLGREADHMQAQIRAAKTLERGEASDRGEVEHLRAEVKELQQMVRRLQARIEAETPRSDAAKP